MGFRSAPLDAQLEKRKMPIKRISFVFIRLFRSLLSECKKTSQG
ncbi:uncharacterized protein METZ01_LOCUS137483 [marine metagenome]|uniref:Uncharacterized protein n=1 Tax=marine metagenome TaxID=408172 RepID=A0A381Z617_9ZZZZ